MVGIPILKAIKEGISPFFSLSLWFRWASNIAVKLKF
jgi:hypothetical protein